MTHPKPNTGASMPILGSGPDPMGGTECEASVLAEQATQREVGQCRAPDQQRRTVLAVLASLPLAACAPAVESASTVASGIAGLSAEAADAERRVSASRTAVVFVSRSGNTRVLAGALARRYRADSLEVRPRDPWPDDYEEMVAWASAWRTRSDAQPLAGNFSLAAYETVFLGFPIWGMAMPALVRSLVSSHDLSRKRVVPFITHGGYGTGDAVEALRAMLPDTEITPPFVLQCDQERDALNKLDAWLEREPARIVPR